MRKADKTKFVWLMKTKVYIKDHLGSNRVVVNTIGYIYQNNIYYALGGTTALSSGQEYQQFKYTDKEYDPMHGLNQYDFSARQYDPAIGRFTSVDPLAEKYYHLTPYSYCGGDPVNAVDPDGRDWYTFNGTYKWYGITDEIYKDKDGNEWTNVGHTYTDEKTNIYYSLFGQKYNNDAVGLKAVKKLDEAIINYAKFEASQINAFGNPQQSTIAFSSDDVSAPFENFMNVFDSRQSGGLFGNGNIHFIKYAGSKTNFLFCDINNEDNAFARGVSIFRPIDVHGYGSTRYKGIGLRFQNSKGIDVVLGVFSPNNIATMNSKYYMKLVKYYGGYK